MVKYYRFAGVEMAVHIPEPWKYTRERTLEPFSVSEVTDPHDFYFAVSEELTPPAGEPAVVQSDYMVFEEPGVQVRYIGAVSLGWEKAYMRAEHRGKEHFVQINGKICKDGITAKTVLNAMQTEHLVAQAGGFVFHCSYIQWQGAAILFTAPSGTGKSTQADLWQKLRGAEIVNGDRAVVRVADGGIFAAGIPFAGSSQICKNHTLPLTAIVYLGQAPQTTIRQLRGAEAFRRVWEGISVNVWDKADVGCVMDTVQQVVQEVPVYHLDCTPDESAVMALEKILRK